MNARFLPAAACLFGLALSGMVNGAPAWAQTVTIPPAPTQPSLLPFDDEVAGRRLLFAAQDAVRAAPVFGYTARISVASVAGGTGSPTTISYTGTETLKTQPNVQKLALTLETAQGKAKQMRRAIADGMSLIATRFEDTGDGKTAPERTFLRLPLEPKTGLSHALRAVQFPLQTANSLLLFRPESPDARGATVWRGKSVTANGARRDVVLEVSTGGERNRPTRRTRRYLLEPTTHRLLRFEEWATTQERARPARRGTPADDGVRILYRREEYSGYPAASVTAFPTTTFAQSLPPSYAERFLSDDPVSDAPQSPENAAPRALALLEKWRTARERYLSLNLDVTQNIRIAARTPDAVPIPAALQNMNVRYGIQYRRLLKTRLTQEAPNISPAAFMGGGRGGFRGGMLPIPRSLLLVSDGTSVRAIERATGNSATRQIRDEGDLWNRIQQAGVSDAGSALEWIYAGVPDAEDFTRIAYEGRTVLDNGEPVEVILLERTQESDGNGGWGRRRLGGGGGRGGADIITRTDRFRVALGVDNLPRMIESVRKTDVSGALERDQQPILTVISRYNNVRVDSEPASTAFVLPLEKNTANR